MNYFSFDNGFGQNFNNNYTKRAALSGAALIYNYGTRERYTFRFRMKRVPLVN